MSASTTPILAATGVTMANQVLFNKHSLDWKVPIAGALVAAAFAGGEAVLGKPVVQLSWLVLLSTLILTPGSKNDPSFIDNLLKWSK
jgi:hypothetical protein